MLKRHDGYVFIDFMLSIFIIMLLSGTLLPLVTTLNENISREHDRIKLYQMLYQTVQSKSIEPKYDVKRYKYLEFNTKVCMKDELKNSKGFTMIEMLLSLSFLLIILALIPLLIKSLYLFKDNAMDHTHFELMMFRKELSDEIKESTIKLDNAQNRIKFINETRSTEFTLLNGKIIKTINGRGNITLVNNVKTFQVDKISNETFKVFIIIRKGDKELHEEIYF